MVSEKSLPPKFPVSVKGVLFADERVILLKNERNEWELPGGRLEPGENPISCLVREIQEELGIAVKIEDIIDCWLYNVIESKEVVIVTYGCFIEGNDKKPGFILSDEHQEFGLFPLEELHRLPMPEGYKRSIMAWKKKLA